MPVPVVVAVLHPTRVGGDQVPPARSPLGRAAHALTEEGIDLILAEHAEGGVVHGARAAGGVWVPTTARPDAVWDRFPDQSRPAAWAALRAALPRLPWGNPPDLVRCCRDKLVSQRVLEAAGVRMPEVEAEPDRFAGALERWGAAFHKPRHGAFGRGVRRVQAGDDVPANGEGAVPGAIDRFVLQRAIPAPPGWAGLCLRALVQAGPTGAVIAPVVARAHRTDPVVNVARGAEAIPAEDLLSHASLAEVEAQVRAVWAALAADPEALELGVDLVIDPDGLPWVIEVNGRPRGRLAQLGGAWPERFAEAEREAALRPARALASRVRARS